MKHRLVSISFNLIIFLIGLLSLLAPFMFQQARNPENNRNTFPITVSLILILCIILVLFEAQSSQLDNKMIAFLGVLVAINSGFRFLENAIPGPAGFSPIFFLIILVGYSFGSKMGFLMGALTMFVSSLITGGVGPWLPSQMITAGWMGQSAGLLKSVISGINIRNTSKEIIFLSIFGAMWGILFGILMNLWFWPFYSINPGQSWVKPASFLQNLGRFNAYYFAVSFVWDITRAIGNGLMLALFSKSILRIFKRFSKRFNYSLVEINTE